jgi:hypothetical protein
MQCKYKHPYPIGYMASKFHFGREWIMYITEDEEGPVFHVLSDKGKLYSGLSPTKPWTDVCIDMTSKVGRTRLSGPLLFGFSDPFVVHAIESLPNFATIGGTPTRFPKSHQSQHFSIRARSHHVPDCSFVNLVTIKVPFALQQYLRHQNGLSIDLEPELNEKDTESIMELLKEYERGLEITKNSQIKVEENELGSLLQLAQDFIGFNDTALSAPSAEAS